MTLLYILISALKSNSQRSDSVDRSQLHTNFGKSYANNTCDSALDYICLDVFFRSRQGEISGKACSGCGGKEAREGMMDS